LDDREKVLMMQVRMIHSFSAAHRHGLSDRGYLELAGKGFDYLVQTMWDSTEGVFFFSVTRDGKPLSRRKNTDFHAYAMTGLLEFGFDHERGGLAAYGPLTGKTSLAADLSPDRFLRPWWTQAEMLNALISVYPRTNDSRYLRALLALFDWIDRYQIDHECGDWYQDVYWDSGQPVTTDKGGEFKTSFHAGRALIWTIEALRIWL